MADQPSVNEEVVSTLAAVADLPLGEGRARAVAGVLGAWLPDANELNRKMSEPGHWTVTPASVFMHPTHKEDAK